MDFFIATAKELGLKYAVIGAVLTYLGRSVVPWCGARLVEAARWCGPRIDRVLDAKYPPVAIDGKPFDGNTVHGAKELHS
jgi:hypothetical protein